MWSRFFVIAAVFLLINLFGAYDPAEQLILKGIFKAYDFVLILSLFPFLLALAIRKKRAWEIFKVPSVKLILWFFALILFSIFRTCLAGGVTFKNVIQMARYYLPYILIIPVIYGIINEKHLKFFRGMILLIGAISTAILFLVIVVKVGWFANWPTLRYSLNELYGTSFIRVSFEPFAFPILAAIIKFWDYFIEKRKIDLLLFFFFSLGFFLQGYRSYIIAAILSILFIILLRSLNIVKIKNYFGKMLSIKATPIIILAVILFSVISGISFNNLKSRIFSAFTDFIKKEGTYEYRLSDNVFRWSVFRKNPVFGLGIIHPESETARILGTEKSGTYSLRTTDTGYLDILVCFGIIGILYFIIFTYYSVRRCFYIVNNVSGRYRAFSLSTATFILVILITQISHSGFTGFYGIVPIALCLGICEASYIVHAKSEDSSKEKQA